MVSVRATMAGWLKPLVPAAWVIVTSERRPDETDRTVLALSQRTIEHATATGAQRGHVVTVHATISVRTGADLGETEDRLDDELDRLLWAIDDTHGQLAWTGAAEKAISDQRLAYELDLFTHTSREEPTDGDT